ncbi:MAG: sigma-70 family RNA polymerase sigma factor [Bacteroidetes bacterium]|nr:sigma-70 family RNA polymerase sigma factor [Bacteroidota bacterium]
MSEISESIIQGCAEKDPGCQKVIYEYYYKRMYAICVRYCGDRDEAKDLLHDGFIKLFDKISSFNEVGKLDAWVRRLFTNHCIDYVRSAYKKYVFNNLDEKTEHYSHDADNEQDDNIFDPLSFSPEELLVAMQSLRPDYRTIINLYALENYSHQEIADKLGIEHTTSRSKLLRARQALKKIILEQTKFEAGK